MPAFCSPIIVTSISVALYPPCQLRSVPASVGGQSRGAFGVGGGGEVVLCTGRSDPALRSRAQTHQKVLSNQSYTFRKIPAMVEDNRTDAAVSVGGRRRRKTVGMLKNSVCDTGVSGGAKLTQHLGSEDTVGKLFLASDGDVRASRIVCWIDALSVARSLLKL